MTTEHRLFKVLSGLLLAVATTCMQATAIGSVGLVRRKAKA